jgi:peptidoglycan/xylan/chitin deacetylase (PgdA/CDA1 family)
MLGSIRARLFLSAAQRKLWGAGLPVFVYHRIALPPPGAQDPFLYVAPRRLDEQLTALDAAGCSAVTLDEMQSAPDHWRNKFVITFDDGCRDVFEQALAILSRQRCPAIQFIVSDFIGKRAEWDVVKGDVPESLMDQAEIKEWLAAGHQIGSHSATHPNLKRLPPSDAREEIFASKKRLEDSFGVAVQHFCYPFGVRNEAVRGLVAEAGYRTACTMDFGVNTAATPRFALHRIAPLSGWELWRKAIHRLGRKTRRR